MELRQLRYFRAVALAGGFRKAAEELSISQPSISHQVRRLELQLGVRLFERKTRPPTLTPAGRRLLEHAERLLAGAETAAADMRQFSTHGGNRLAVGAMQYLTFLELPELLVRFQQAHPEITVTVNIGNSGELEALLHRGDVDIAIAHVNEDAPPTGLSVQRLRQEEIVLLVGPSHPLAARGEVEIGELADSPFVVSRPGGRVRETFEASASASGFTPRVAFETADMATTLALVSRDLGVATVPRSLVLRGRDDVVTLSLRPDPPMLTVSLLRAATRTDTFGARAFARIARTTFQQL